MPKAECRMLKAAKTRARTSKDPKPPKTAAETRRILTALSAQHPGADTELHFTNAYELLVATILSAQCTDERVNQVTPALFKRYPDARALARATTDGARAADPVDRLLPRQVASLLGMATAVVEEHGGRSARHDGGARRAAGRRPQDRQRRARPRARRARDCRSIGTCCASPTASASRNRTIPRSSSSSSLPRCRRPSGRGRPTR